MLTAATSHTLSVADKMRGLRGACCELAALHRAGLVHGDVKPENIVLGAGGSGHMVDFGNVGPLGQEWYPPAVTYDYALPLHAGSIATGAIDAYGLTMTAAAIILMEGVPLDVNDRPTWVAKCPFAARLLACESPVAQLRVFDGDSNRPATC